MWGACVTCTRVKVLGAGAQELPVHVRRCWVWGARVTCTREKVLGVGRKSYLYT